MEIRIDENRLLGFARDLVRTSSGNPPGNEIQVANLLEAQMRELGLKVDRYDFRPRRPNLIGIQDFGKGHSVIFDGHMDTVPAGNKDLWSVDPFSGKIMNGRLYGRGTADMKSSIAAWFSALEAVLNAGIELRGRVLTCLVSDEEVSGLGTEDILSKGYFADMAVVGEPTGLTLQIAHKGVIRWRLTTLGKAGHISSPEEGVNAIQKMAKVSTISVGTIRGGEKDNIIPARCEVSVDRRLIPGEEPGEAETELIQLLEAMKKKDKDFEYKLERYVLLQASEIEPDEEVVSIFERSVKKVTGRKARIEGFSATCEMVHLVKMGIPTIIFGAGSLSQAHKVDEYVNVEEIIAAAKIYAEFIVEALGGTLSQTSNRSSVIPPTSV
jgi:acetylornithine deacetylase/succinyl-diaminopimelate desuccinylase-like protein